MKFSFIPLLLALVCSLAFAGEEVVDLGIISMICAGDDSPAYFLRKKQGSTTVDYDITNADYDALVQAAGVSETAFDSEADDRLNGVTPPDG